MSRFRIALQNDLQLLKLLRDEVKLHAHLLKADLKDRYHELEAEAEKLGARVEDTVEAELEAKAEGLKKSLQTVRESFEQMRDAVKR